MSENLTLDAYENLLNSVVTFKEQYELFDSNVVQAIETFNSDALRSGASYIQKKMGDGFEGYLSHFRTKIYGTTEELAKNVYGLYKTACDQLEGSPKSFNLSFRTFPSVTLSGNRSGSIQLRDAKQAYEVCNFVRSRLISSYPILTQAYARMNTAVNDARNYIVLQHVSRVDGWMKTIADGVRQAETPYKVTIRTLEILIEKMAALMK